MSNAVHFAHAVRTLSESARLMGVEVPIFRTPPRRSGQVRTIQRSRRSALVSVAVQDRPWPNVLADLIDGIVVVNDLNGAAAIRCRTALWSALERESLAA